MIYKIIIGGIIVTIIAILAFQAIDPKINGNTIEQDTTNNDSEDSNSYTISGEITRSGTYVLTGVITMGDLIEAAGDLKSNADERCFFIDSELTPKGSYYISRKYDVNDVCGNNPIEKVNINTADLSSLITIDSIGNTLAKNIIEYRDADGRFDTLEEVKNVTGIGNSIFAKIKDQIILQD